MMVDVETEVVVAPGDIIKERRAAEGSDCGHMCSDGGVFHYLSIHLQTFGFLFYPHLFFSLQPANTHITSAWYSF